jgi:hypothetical protein
MTPAQTAIVEPLRRAGFEVVVECDDIIRVTRGADKRVIFKDGSQKRGHHTARGEAR